MYMYTRIYTDLYWMIDKLQLNKLLITKMYTYIY